MILIETWDADACGRSVSLGPICPVCHPAYALGSRARLDPSPFPIHDDVVMAAHTPKEAAP